MSLTRRHAGFTLGLAIAVATWVIAILIAGEPAQFVDGTSALVVFLPSLALALGTGSGLPRARQVRLFGQYALYSGVIAAIIGLVQLGSSLIVSEWTSMSHARRFGYASTMLVPILYGVAARALAHAVDTHLSTPERRTAGAMLRALDELPLADDATLSALEAAQEADHPPPDRWASG